MPTYPSWFHHTRCSLCEQFRRESLTCSQNNPINEQKCNKANEHILFSQKLGDKRDSRYVDIDTDIQKPGGAIRVPGPITRICTHPNLVPLESSAGKETWTKENSNSELAKTIDWNSNIINAHVMRVTKYWCPSCDEVVIPPDYSSDE